MRVHAGEECSKPLRRFGVSHSGPSIRVHSKEIRFPVVAPVVAASLEEFVEGPQFVRRHEGAETLLAGRSMEADGETIGTAFRSEPADPGNDPDRADGDAGRTDRQSARVGNDAEGMHDGLVIVKGLAHAHEDEIAHALLRIDRSQDAPRVVDLGDDFAGTQVPHESHLPGRAKDTTHRASGLRADTDGVPPLVAHQDGLDRLAVAEAEEEFPGESSLLGYFLDGFGAIEEPPASRTEGPLEPAVQRGAGAARRRVPPVSPVPPGAGRARGRRRGRD